MSVACVASAERERIWLVCLDGRWSSVQSVTRITLLLCDRSMAASVSVLLVVVTDDTCALASERSRCFEQLASTGTALVASSARGQAASPRVGSALADTPAI